MTTDNPPAPLTPDELLLWQSLGRLVHALPRALEDDMSRTGVTMTEFAVLLILSQAPEHRMRMSALAASAGLTPSRITRVVDDLTRHDLVRKERHSKDSRGNDAILTTAGLQMMRQTQPTHLSSARRRVVDQITPTLLPSLAQTLAALADSLSPPTREA
ncbi:MarR family winged helix-turn-helix transcriptional regulator [Actinoplanes palleronii]|uniref:MarR family transcriptional regulator n=1 Tax=Actinoplanes palleronii TaxID=113570 RepID=A0ABQ4BGT1_9ACTN|nr:MarR family transcriptional regulator [Actinoplanes palleronii]GIE69891.1 MarR family transcriptional regulator [Actinoplanes palleronii]